MFTGIVQALIPVTFVQEREGLTTFSLLFPKSLLKGLQLGASVSVDGVCLTVTRIEDNHVFFDVIQETLKRTTLDKLSMGRKVNVERSLKMGQELGGHIVSGHVFGKAPIVSLDSLTNQCKMTLQLDPSWKRFIVPKGFIAIDGVSLTVSHEEDLSVYLIPETLQRTTLGFKKIGDIVNVELEGEMQRIVLSVERYLENKK